MILKIVIIGVLLLLGCGQLQPIEKPTKSVEGSAAKATYIYREEACFYCSEFKLVLISHDEQDMSNTTSYDYGCMEWKYHCIGCDRPTTGDLDVDFQLRKKHPQQR